MSPARPAVYILVSPVIFWWYQCEINLAHIPYCCFNTVMNIPSYCPDAFPSPGSHAHVRPQNELMHHLPPELVEGYLLHLLPLYKYNYNILYTYISLSSIPELDEGEVHNLEDMGEFVAIFKGLRCVFMTFKRGWCWEVRLCYLRGHP